METIIIGNGFIANQLPYTKIKDRILPDNSQISAILDTYNPKVVINCIGYCGEKNIDDCENNKEKTIISNTIIPTLLAFECNKRNIHFINISSGCIFFDYNKELTELDLPNPKSYYSKSKYALDLAISNLPNVTSLRIRMPISNISSPRNLIDKLIKYPKIIDIQNSVTFIDEFVQCIDFVIKNKVFGVFNAVNSESLSAKDIIEEYSKHVDHKYSIISKEELDAMTLAERSNCLLSNKKLEDLGFKFSSAKILLKSCMKQYCKGKS